MFNESLLFKEEHEVKAKKIMENLPEARQVICIAGISGSGKSEVAWWLARKLYRKNITSHIINLDRFYKVKVDDRTEHRIKTGVIGWQEMDWLKINQEVVNFHSCYDSFDYLIVEGLYGGYVNSGCFKVFLDAEDTYEFRKLRGKENPDDNFRKFVLYQENYSVLKKKDEADLII